MQISTPGKLVSPKLSKISQKKNTVAGMNAGNPRGMTLIEMMIAMAIVGLIFAVSATGLKSMFGASLKGTASQMSSTLRYLSNKAVTDHMYLRVVYSFEDQSYHVEESHDPFVISPEDEQADQEKKKEKKSKNPDAESPDSAIVADTETSNTGNKEDAEKVKPPPFTQSESRLLQPVKLPNNVFFKDIKVSYLKDKRESGEAYTYFFPDGFATPTIINLRDEDDQNHYSIEVFPLSGRVKLTGDYRESLTEDLKK